MAYSRKRLFLMLVTLVCLLCFAGAAKTSAASVNVVSSAKTAAGGRWLNARAGKMYIYSDGTWAKNTWLKIGENIYRFNARGVCQTGWISYGGSRYFADASGKLYVNRFRTVGSVKCYFMSDGTLAVNRWVKIGSGYYYFTATGRMYANTMFTVNGKTYYVSRSGLRISNLWVKLGGKLYYFDANGVRAQSGWRVLNGKYYYFDSNGVMARSKWIDGYYVTASGARLTDCVLGGYYLDETGKKAVKVFKGKYIFVGDSRMVGMSQSVTSSDVKFIAKTGAGYSWLKSTGGVELEYYLKSNPNVKVVFGFGVNDLANIASYITYYRNLVQAYPRTSFYMLSVNPVDEEITKNNKYPVTDTMIRQFNLRMYLAFPSDYVNSYYYLCKNGYTAMDGLHYDTATNSEIYQFIISKIR